MFLSFDIYSELSELELYYHDINSTEEKLNYKLFIYLVGRGYIQEASELWDSVIINNCIAPSSINFKTLMIDCHNTIIN